MMATTLTTLLLLFPLLLLLLSTSSTVVVHCLSSSNAPVVVVTPDRRLVLEGMEAFRNGDIQGSIDKFDSSIYDASGRTGTGVNNNVKAYLWQRGISYYYADQFQKGSQQFRDDVLQSPLDVEEIVWDAACLMRLEQQQQLQQQSQQKKSGGSSTDGDFKVTVTVPPPNMLSLPKGKQDRRPIMGTVLKLFEGKATEHDLAQIGHSASGSSPADEFYSNFYLGLYAEAVGGDGEENLKAEAYMKTAARSQYARSVGSRDYMVDCARVHCKLRHWL